jgi:hypothetical protein
MIGKMFYTAIAFIIFNRPETTEVVLEQIRRLRPRRLYVIADGPREDVPGELEQCKATRALIDTIDWDCQVYKNYSDKNLGCGVRVATGISWAFENEDRLIILEDDTVPTEDFFFFCEELLERYQLDSRIWTICGSNFFTERRLNDDSYFFSQYGSIWGWATWKRAWQHYDFSMGKWPLFKDLKFMRNVFRTPAEARRFTQMFDEFYKKRRNIWTVQYLFMVWSNGGLFIIPEKNLVTNIGTIGTHTVEKSFFHAHATVDDYQITKHPSCIIANRYYDTYIYYKQWHQKQLIPQFITKIIPSILKNLLREHYKKCCEWVYGIILNIKSIN